MTTNWQFKGKYIITGKIECVTGLHIGGNTEGFEIGGMDNPVIINPLDDKPYIPGSSLKGKLRHLSEWGLGMIRENKKQGEYPPCDCRELEKPFDKVETDKDKKQWQNAYKIGRIFGPANPEPKIRETVGPTRLSVRDTFLTPDSADKLEQWLGKGIYTEAKTENAIDRVTAVANPRPIERVPAGAEFEFTLIFDVYRDDDPALLQELFSAMAMLEDSALGGGGSRGHGVIKFKDLAAEWRPLAYYKNGTAATTKTIQSKDDVKKLVKDFKFDDWQV
jgi:CRISPR-associated protein Csm3